MDDFEEVATRLRRVNVIVPDQDDVHGVLCLDGENSSIELTGNINFGDVPPPGWFDLHVCESNGRRIFVHNAVQTKVSFPVGNTTRSMALYPNLLVDNANALDADNRLRSISFGLDGWNACFAYNFFEPLKPFGPRSKMLTKALASARHAPLRDEPFIPHDVYIVNNLGMLVDFEVDGRQYSIFAGRRSNQGRNRIDEQVRLIGRIDFPEPVDLDAATDACWDWRRFFNQMSMAKLQFTGMAIATSFDPQSPRGNIYLPSEQHSRQMERGVDRYHMPLNQWREREALGDAMQRWLLLNEERRFFRAAIDRVIARPGHIAVEDAVALCAGVETLTELSSREALPNGVLDSMALAAIEAAKASEIELDLARVRGLLGSLQNENLRSRLKQLATGIIPGIETAPVKRWIELLIELRLSGAHGRRPSTDHDLIAGSAVDALAALCVRYDLQAAGVPSNGANGARSHSALQLDEAMFALTSSESQS